MNEKIKRAKSYISSHRKVTVAVILVLFLAIYFGYKNSTSTTTTSYVLATVEKGTIVSTVTGSGQVSTSNEVSLSPKASGELLYLNAKVGQEVKKGTLIARLDSGDAAYELESAQISYDDLVTIDPNDLRNANLTVDKANEDLASAYEKARIDIMGNLDGMSTDLEELNTLLNGYISSPYRSTFSDEERAIIEKAWNSYDESVKALDDLKTKSLTISNQVDKTQMDSVLDSAYNTASSIAQTAKYVQDSVSYLRDKESTPSRSADTAYTNANSTASDTNTILSTLSSDRNNAINAERSLETAQIALQDLKNGPDTSTLRSSELSLRQKKEALSNYYVYAPFNGVIASVNAKVGDDLNSGTEVATLITKDKLAEISLNEVDVAKVKVGQKATLTFDALENLSMTGTVSEVDLVGTVSQGVVSYNVKVSFDTENDQVKPGMSVSVSIITDSKTDALIIPSSAVKNSGDTQYVLKFPTPITESANSSQGVTSDQTPEQIIVQTGISDDTNIEITSGLKEGDQIISRVITGSTSSQNSSSLLGGSNIRMRGF